MATDVSRDKKEDKIEKKSESFSSYNVIRNRLLDKSKELKEKLDKIDQERVGIFGESKNTLLKSEALITENSCIPRDIVQVGNKVILGYNVHIGLKTQTKLSDIFAIYEYTDDTFKLCDYLDIEDSKFVAEFKDLFKYYKKSFFSKFHEKDGFIYMVFQNGSDVQDIKTFKWLVKDNGIEYVGNRFSHEVVYPSQHELEWIRATREDQVNGLHPHISIKDKLFVESIGGDVTFKIENNTNSGKGIYSEEVEDKDQTLDDGEILYAFVGNIILLKIRPYKENNYRYFAFNEKTKEVKKVDSIGKAVVILPENHGIIFPDGIFLQSGGFQVFEIDYENIVFQNRKSSSNGEDFQYIFYNEVSGEYYIHNYNIIRQNVDTPLLCNGYSHFDNGEMLVFQADNEPKRNHTMQIWQTSFGSDDYIDENVNKDSFYYKIGNKEIVRLMSDCYSLYNLIKKEDNYFGLYVDIVRDSEKIANNYFWVDKEEVFKLNETLKGIKEAGSIAIKEFDKINKIKENSAKQFKEVNAKVEKLLKDIGYATFENINDFVKYLTKIRKVRGEIAGLKELQFIDLETVEKLNNNLKEKNNKLSEDCVTFLLNDEALSPYIEQVEEIEKKLTTIKKVVDGNDLNDKIIEVSEELELLINIVSNLKIEDATKTAEIIDKISVLFAKLNQNKSKLSNIIKNLDSKERKAEFYSKMNLITHSVSNYLDLSDEIGKVESYMSKIIVQIDELESKFSDYDEFIPLLTEKREEVLSTFETKKQQLMEKRSKKIDSLGSAADRIFKGIENRIKSLEDTNQINELFSTDLMIDKLRDIIDRLINLGDSTKADDIENRLKSLKENSIRQLKDKKELFIDGNTIKLGNHQFLVNNQKAEISFLQREKGFFFHISGTDFWEKIPNGDLLEYEEVWNQEVLSENSDVYRGEFLAYNILKEYRNNNNLKELYNISDENIKKIVKEYVENHSSEYYTKGVHDFDGAKILKSIVNTFIELELAAYSPQTRSVGNLFWKYGLADDEKLKMSRRLKSISLISKYSDTGMSKGFIPEIAELIKEFIVNRPWINSDEYNEIAGYLVKEIGFNDNFVISAETFDLYKGFNEFLISINAKADFTNSIEKLENDIEGKYIVISEWIRAFYDKENFELNNFNDELCSVILIGDYDKRRVISKESKIVIKELVGVHEIINNGKYEINIIDFMTKMDKFANETVEKYKQFNKFKFEKMAELRERLKFKELTPSVLTSFVRNKLIDKVYLPLIGDNFAKQIGAAGAGKRTDNMGLLLMISPPGYGKTTLVEYVASRLNMMLVKINCPTIGHNVTSLDPDQADNANAKEELKKLNLAFEIGNNVMIYLDDIQHSNPEFLQKFISLCDGTRKIEGIYEGKSKTYEFRGKKVAVVMAGNPYTESGDKFNIPDMLSNRADVYNLGDMLNENEEAFKLSYIENAITSNSVLNNVFLRNSEDIYGFLNCVETGDRENIELNENYTEQEIEEVLTVMKSMVNIREEILTVNMEYIYSASQNDEYRTEPPFKLQGSYRNMNKIAEKVVAVMNQQEIRKLVESSYENDAQTLASDAEASVLKFREITGRMTDEKRSRWEEIKTIYMKNKSGDDSNKVEMLLEGLNNIGESISNIGRKFIK